MPESLDFALIKRLREVLDSRPATESELRLLTEQAEAWALTVSGQLESSERRIRRLNQNPASSLAQIASELRRVERLRPQLNEVRTLLAELEQRARQVRTQWLLSQATSPTVRPRCAASPAEISNTLFAPRAPARRHGRKSAAIFTTRRSRSRKTASIGKRMKAMCTDDAGFNRIPSPLGSSRRPSRPLMRVSADSARRQRSHTMVPSSRRSATACN